MKRLIFQQIKIAEEIQSTVIEIDNAFRQYCSGNICQKKRIL